MATNGLHNGLAEANAVLQQDQGRVAVHSFDPSATPAEKSAAAGKGRDQLKSANYQEGAGERGLYDIKKVYPIWSDIIHHIRSAD